MKRLIPFLFLFAVSPAQAGYIHKITTSAQGIVDGSYSNATRLGSTYSMSSSGVTAGTLGKLTAPGADNNGDLTGVAATMGTTAYTQTVAGSATSLTESFTMGDNITSATAVSATTGATATLPSLGSTVTYSGGNRTTMAVGITTVGGGTVTLTPGSSGTSVTGSVTSTLQVD